MEEARRDTTDERRLLAAARAGDERAFGRLLEVHRRGLELYCYLMLGSPRRAHDAVEEIVLQAWRRREPFEPRARTRIWLFRLATYACLDELERRDR